jgi:hypothetical protein
MIWTPFGRQKEIGLHEDSMYDRRCVALPALSLLLRARLYPPIECRLTNVETTIDFLYKEGPHYPALS